MFDVNKKIKNVKKVNLIKKNFEKTESISKNMLYNRKEKK